MALNVHYYTKLEEGNFYHVYNQAVDRKPLFSEKRNYDFFLTRMVKYIIPFLDVYAFCLLGDHFHLLVKIKKLHKIGDKDSATLKELPNLELPNLELPNLELPNLELPNLELPNLELPNLELPNLELPNLELPNLELPNLELPNLELPNLELPNLELPNLELPNLELPNLELPNLELPNLELPNLELPNLIASSAFRKMFQSYAMAFNKQESRIGTLFQEPFKRSLIDTEEYLIQMIYYIHFNPQKHGLINDFRSYPYSSYPYYVDKTSGPWMHKDLYNLFGGYDGFMEFHNNIRDDPGKRYSIENE